MNRPTVSVIIPCYNGAPHLAEAIRSALGQTHVPAEILVVDDGSIDGSAEIAEGFTGVRCLRQVNQGVSAARNAGLRETRGEFVAFLDSDDRLLPGAIELGLREIQTSPEIGFVYGFSREIDLEGAIRPTPDPEPIVCASFALLLGGRSLVPPAVALFRRAAIEKAGGFRMGQALAEDHDLYLRISREFPIHCHNQVVAEYRLHEGNAGRRSPTRTLQAILATINAQNHWIAGNPDLEEAARAGRRHWSGVFGPHIAYEMMANVKRGRLGAAWRAGAALARHYPRGFLDYAYERLGLRRA